MTKLKDIFGMLLLKVYKIDVPMTGFISFLLYNFLVGFSIASSIVSFSIVILYGFKMYLDHNKQLEATQEMLNRLERIEGSLSALKIGSGFREQNNEKPKRIF